MEPTLKGKYFRRAMSFGPVCGVPPLPYPNLLKGENGGEFGLLSEKNNVHN